MQTFYGFSDFCASAGKASEQHALLHMLTGIVKQRNALAAIDSRWFDFENIVVWKPCKQRKCHHKMQNNHWDHWGCLYFLLCDHLLPVFSSSGFQSRTNLNHSS